MFQCRITSLWLRIGICLVVIAPSPFASGSDDYDENEVLYARRIANLLVEKCIACHGGDPEDIQGGLDLRSSTGWLTGGESEEPSLVAGDADSSPIYQAATRESDEWSAMPPKDAEALTAEQLDWLKRWIDGGAKSVSQQQIEEISAAYNDRWSAEDGITVQTSGGLGDSWTLRRYDPAGLWAYQPIVAPPIEASSTTDAIDTLLGLHRPAALKVAPPASRADWIRRATFDLTGLPPTAERISRFVTDPRDDDTVYAELVDELLESPHYGERMAQHWLDVVRYADSSGFANDYERGNAWRYRDYVIRSFNEDKPYDQFIREQIAGDEISPEDPEAVIATGFLRMGPWELTGMEVAKIARQRFLDDVTNSVGETFLGHSLQCARCHDHKFDPVPTRDYYAIQAVFATTQLADRKAALLDIENRANFDEQKYLKLRKAEHQRDLDAINETLLRNAQQWHVDQGVSPEKWNEAVEFVAQKNGGKADFKAARNRMAAQGVDQEAYPPKLVGLKPDEFGLERVARKGLQRLAWEMDRYQPYALSVYNGRTPNRVAVYTPFRVPDDRMTSGELEQSCILTGGDPFSPGEPVEPSGLSVLDDQLQVPFTKEVAGRRTALANWIADRRNPLTVRVIVNRIWQWHFGRAIAGNPNNFGSTGKRPTHPELLDYLAASFVDGAWKFKPLHRAMMLSDAYRQSSSHPAPDQLDELDPLHETYSVFPRRRLTAEELRDAMLSVTGELNTAVGGIPVRPEINLEVALQPRQVMGSFAAAWSPNPLPEQRHRRSIYASRLRGLALPLFEVFNAPSPDFSCERRENSTVTPQVFTLWNSQASYARAMSLAISITDHDDKAAEVEDGSQPLREQMLVDCFNRCFGRQPTANELTWCMDLWRSTVGLLTEEDVAAARALPVPPTKVTREAIEENTGERFVFDETLYSNRDFVPDHDPQKINPRTIGLADVCLALMNSNEFVYID